MITSTATIHNISSKSLSPLRAGDYIVDGHEQIVYEITPGRFGNNWQRCDDETERMILDAARLANSVPAALERIASKLEMQNDHALDMAALDDYMNTVEDGSIYGAI